MRCLCLPDVLYDCICKDKWSMKGSHQARYVWDVEDKSGMLERLGTFLDVTEGERHLRDDE